MTAGLMLKASIIQELLLCFFVHVPSHLGK